MGSGGWVLKLDCSNRLLIPNTKCLNVQLTLLWSWLARSIDGDFNCLCVSGDLARVRADGDGNGEWFAAAASPNKSEIVKFGDLVLHHSCAIAKFSAVILVVPGFYCHDRSVLNVVQSDDFEGTRKTFVGSPVIGEGRAENRRWSRRDQLAVVVL